MLGTLVEKLDKKKKIIDKNCNLRKSREICI